MTKRYLRTILLLISAAVSMVSASAFADEENIQPADMAVAVNDTEENLKSEEADPRGEAAENSYDGTALPAEEEAPAAVAPDEAEETEETEITMAQYEENTAAFNHVPITEVYPMFTEDGKEHVIYIGRPTCYHCRQFSPALKVFNSLIDKRLEYYNTDGEDFDEKAKHFLYATVGIPGTPTVIRLQNGKMVSAWIGSGISGQELYEHLFYNDTLTARTEESEPADTAGETLATARDNLDSNAPRTPAALSQSQETADTAKAAPVSLEHKHLPQVHVQDISIEKKPILPHLGANASRFAFYGFMISALGFIFLKRTPKNLKKGE